MRPERTPANSTRSSALPSSAISQRTGRPKAVSPSDQRMDLRNGILPHTSASTAGKRLAVGDPFSTRRPATYSPLSVAFLNKASIGTPIFCAKLWAALVGLPSASKATRAGGPSASSSRSGWADARPVAMRARRRAHHLSNLQNRAGKRRRRLRLTAFLLRALQAGGSGKFAERLVSHPDG